MNMYLPNQVDEIVGDVVGQNRIVSEPDTGRWIHIEPDLGLEEVRKWVTAFCESSESSLAVRPYCSPLLPGNRCA